MASKSAQKNEKSQTAFQWTPEMIQHLILCLKEYKTEMDYKNIDFNSDVVVMYSTLRERMALEFDEECFGPVGLPEADCDTMTVEQEKKFQTEVGLAKSLTKKGYNRIKEKIRAIRKCYNKAVTNGMRSGKIVQEYYDQLAEIWKGSPATEQLGFGISSNAGESSTSTSNMPSESSSELDNSLLSQLSETPPDEAHATEDPLLDDSSDDADNDEGTPEPRKRLMSSTPKIVDNKRKHLEKPLSAAKRDEVLLRAAREDIALKKQHMSNMQESQNALIEMAKSMSSSLNTLGKSVSDGLGLLAMALNPNVMQMANNAHNPIPLINQAGTQVPYPNNNQFHHNQQPLHMPCNPYQNPLGMPVCSNQTSAAQTQPQYHGRFSNTNNISSPNGKTYEQL